MNNSICHRYLFLPLALALVAVSPLPAFAQNAASVDRYGESEMTADSISIHPSPRPVALAVERLQATYGIPITYEDAKYVHDSEIGETTLANHKTAKTLKQRTSLLFNYAPPPDGAALDVRKKLAGEALASAIQQFNSGRGGDTFAVTETERGFHVVAKKYTGTSGSTEDLHPLLDTPITLPPGKRTIQQAVEDICKAIPTLSVGVVPTNLFQQHQTDISATNEPARSVLDRLMKEIPVWAEKQVGPDAFKDTPEGGYVSWELRTDPDPKWGSALSFTIVKPPGTI